MTWTLAPEAMAAGYRLQAFDTIGSTSDEAAARAKRGEGGPLWFVSAHQSAGRGRRGNPWATPPGNLAASLLLTTNRSPADIATLGFVAGVALVRALDVVAQQSNARPSPLQGEDGGCGGRARITLKWPNDVLADGAKLAGVLLGADETSPGRRAVVVGIGVNVRHAPAGLPYAAASLAGLGLHVTAEAVFAALSGSWVEAHAAWEQPGGFAAIRRDWLGRAAGIGGDVTVRTGEAVVSGIFETLDPTGQLLLREPDGTARAVSAGEVHFGSAATARPECTA